MPEPRNEDEVMIPTNNNGGGAGSGSIPYCGKVLETGDWRDMSC